jgi:hypothetical protein
MPLTNLINALRRNIATSLTTYQRESGGKASEIVGELQQWSSEKNYSETLSASDLSRVRNTTGNAGSVSLAKLSMLDRFLKDTNRWRQAAVAVPSDIERYYSQIGEYLAKMKSPPPGIIERFPEERRKFEIGSEPELNGLYIVIRKSMHALGQYNISKIEFEKHKTDPLIFTFREERHINKTSGQKYVVHFDGFVYFIRNTYILQGVTTSEATPTPFPEIMYIHNDRDIYRLVGTWSSVTLEGSEPFCSPVVMRKVLGERVVEEGLLGVNDGGGNFFKQSDLEIFDQSTRKYPGSIIIDGKFFPPL